MRNLPATLLVLASLVPAACDDLPAPARLSPRRCQEEVLKLRAWLADLTSDPGETLVPLRKSIQLVTANIKGAEKPEVSGPLVEIDARGFRLGEHRIDPAKLQPGKLVDRLAALLGELLTGSEALTAYRDHKSRTWGLLVAADREAPWSHLVAIHDAAARAGFGRLAFLFRPHGEKRLESPGPSPIDAELQEISAEEDPLKKLPRLAKLAKRVCSACDPLDNVFKTLSVTNPQVRSAVLNSKLPVAVASCGCAVNLASLRALLAIMYERRPLIAAWFDISVQEQEKEKLVTESADRPWKETHLYIVSITKPGDSPRLRMHQR